MATDPFVYGSSLSVRLARVRQEGIKAPEEIVYACLIAGLLLERTNIARSLVTNEVTLSVLPHAQARRILKNELFELNVAEDIEKGGVPTMSAYVRSTSYADTKAEVFIERTGTTPWHIVHARLDLSPGLGVTLYNNLLFEELKRWGVEKLFPVAEVQDYPHIPIRVATQPHDVYL